MSTIHLTLVPTDAAPPSPAVTADILARALADRTAPARTVQAQGREASPGEGLSLVEDFLAITDPGLRQAVLDAVAALARPPA